MALQDVLYNAPRAFCDLTWGTCTSIGDAGRWCRRNVERLLNTCLPPYAAKVVLILASAIPTFLAYLYCPFAMAAMVVLYEITQVRSHIIDSSLACSFGLELIYEASRFVGKNLATATITGHAHIVSTVVCALLGAFYLHRAKQNGAAAQ